jgi:phosphopantothenoylcysteine decarboxylase/phosphopantothenate--cysteine ligase
MSQAQNQNRRILITAGPTHEPIDAVRYIGNRSSGRLGISLATEAARRGWSTTLLLGPVPTGDVDTHVRLRRFRTASDLEGLLREEAPGADVLVMAAAVSDYRTIPHPGMSEGKFRRQSTNLQLELEPTPDLLAGVSAGRRAGQLLVGFALEPRHDMVRSGREKLRRKGVDMVVANPLETMDSGEIEAVLIRPDGEESSGPAMSKERFAGWLLDRVEGAWRGGR